MLIKGGISDWPCMKKWNPQYISEEFGETVCTLVTDGRPAYSKTKTTLGKYFDDHEGKSTLTLERFERGNAPGFFNDIIFPSPYFSEDNVYRYFFFHSPKDGGTLPHMHRDAFNMLQSGKKRWVLHDANKATCPNGLAAMREYLDKYFIGTHARDWFANELEDLTQRVEKVYECVQEAGDIVFIPVAFSHVVVNLSEVMGLVIERNR